MSAKRSSNVVRLEPLEVRQLLSAALPGLDYSLQFKAPAILLPGTKQTAKLEVTNTTAALVETALPVIVYVSDQPTLDATDSNQQTILNIDPPLRLKANKSKALPIHFTMPASFVGGTCYVLVSADQHVFSSSAMFNPSAGYGSGAHASAPTTPNDSTEYLDSGTWTAAGQTNDISLNVRSYLEGSVYSDLLASGNFGQISIPNLLTHITQKGIFRIYANDASANIYLSGSSGSTDDSGSGSGSSSSNTTALVSLSMVGTINADGEITGSIHLATIKPKATSSTTGGTTGQTAGTQTSSSTYIPISGSGGFAVDVGDYSPDVSAGADQIGQSLNYTGSFMAPNTGDTWTAAVDYGDGSGPQSLALNSDNTFTLSHTYAADGAYTVVVDVTDAAGNSGSDSFVFTSDNTAPTVTIDQTQNIYADPSTNTTFTGTYSDANMDPNGLSVTIDDGNGNSQTFSAVLDTTSNTWSAEVSTTGLSNGTYSITADATDLAGNSSTATSPAQLIIGTDPAAVTVDLDQLPQTLSSNFTLTGDYPDPSYVGTINVTLTNSQGYSLPSFTTYTVNNARGTWSAPVSIAGVPDGAYTVTATDTDTGWITTIPGSGLLTISTIGSNVQFDPTQLPLATNTNQTLTGTYDATDADGSKITAITVNLTNSSGTQTSFNATLNTANDTWSAPVAIANLADGAYTVSATATDSAGNSGAAAAPGSFTLDTLVNTLGSDIVFPVSGNAEQSITLEADTTDFTLTFQGQTTSDITPSDTQSDTAAAITTALEGLNNIGTGNVSVLAESGTQFLVTFTGTLAGKAEPTMTSSNGVTIQTVQSGANQWPVITSADVTLTGTYTNPDSQDGPDGNGDVITAIILNLTDSQGNVKSFAATVGDGTWSVLVNAGELKDGTYTATMTAFDSNGNTGVAAAPGTFTKRDISFTPDQLPIVTDTSTDQTITGTNASTDIYGSQVTNIMVYLTDAQGNQTQFAATLNASDHSWSADITPGSLAVGTYSVEATIFDANNNAFTAMASGTFTVN